MTQPTDAAGPTGTAPQAPPSRPGRQLLAASVGNVVEWFDWVHLQLPDRLLRRSEIFPKSGTNSLVPVLSAFAVFAVGFFMRPLGGLLVGAFADR